MNDIFLDNNIVKHFTPPLTQEYKELASWLYEEGALVVSQKLLNEYIHGLSHVKFEDQTILGIINKLTQQGRLNKIENRQLSNLIIPKRREKKFLSNREDHFHIKTILLSYRKLAISKDNNLCTDINNHPKVDKIKPRAANKPTGINYRD